jgi:uncharacterized phage protein (TIGR01671 family)
MREIKFRAWNKYHKKMYYVYELDFDSDLAGCKSINEGSTHTFGFIDLELMQLTGLKDKNGKDIYESDFVGFDVRASFEPHSTPRRNERGTVEIHPSITALGCWDSAYCCNISVLGNIYENTELLN